MPSRPEPHTVRELLADLNTMVAERPELLDAVVVVCDSPGTPALWDGDAGASENGAVMWLEGELVEVDLRTPRSPWC